MTSPFFFKASSCVLGVLLAAIVIPGLGFGLFSASAAFAAPAKAKPASGFLPQAPHGGMVRENNKMNLELVSQGQDVYLYPLAKMGEPLPATEIDVVVTVTAAPPPAETESAVTAPADHPKAQATPASVSKATQPAAASHHQQAHHQQAQHQADRQKDAQVLTVQLDSDHYKVHIPFSGPYQLVVRAKKKNSTGGEIEFKFDVNP
jgi:hypothetical protein